MREHRNLEPHLLRFTHHSVKSATERKPHIPETFTMYSFFLHILQVPARLPDRGTQGLKALRHAEDVECVGVEHNGHLQSKLLR